MAVDYDYDQLFPGRFLKSGEFKGKDVTLTLANVKLEEMEDKRKGTVTKCILSFRETKKQLVLNKTNGECLKGMFGRRVADWIGKRVTLFPDNVRAFGSTKLAIRVRGSPDIASDKEIACQIGTDVVTVKMMKTATKNGQKQAAPTPAPAPQVEEPPADVILPGQAVAGMDPDTGEIPFN